jgi:hypothetical protein
MNKNNNPRTGRVNDAVALVNDAVKPTHPLSSITNNANTRHREWARKRRDEKVPCSTIQSVLSDGPFCKTPLGVNIHIV